MILCFNKERIKLFTTDLCKNKRNLLLIFLVLLILVNVVIVSIYKNTSYTNNTITPENTISFNNFVSDYEVMEDLKSPIDLSIDLQTQLDTIAEKYGAKAVQVAVINDGSVKYNYEYGYADISKEKLLSEDSKFRLASLSKLSTAMAVMTLYDQGLIDLDTDIGTYLGYEVRNPNYPDIVITPRMLMTHTSSLVDSESFIEARNSSNHTQIQSLIKKCWSKRMPGSSFSYSNFGVAVLAAATEKITGQL